MASTFYGNTATSATLRDRVAARLDTARIGLGNWRTYRRTLNELSALSNRDLADLGLSRSMIRAIALEAAYGK
ncbi:DUF1127 domain-containing protein [Jannaschia rubra]|uniref:YjiS-like domain-containing protein n=1 Tax=Jannaschia rubra TaxID=282197 RepID=A0A0M6XPC2_9RHOB|nr:DUF1127 domain-containing protein [Jannaschia rubra]CTQ32023.1 hypothetical protein JAN5088_00782 [Jannaschia rubra]SFG39602.1 protein of unknown function [Jannaschia rubra]